MKRVKTLFVQFENSIAPHRISAFRGAIIEKVGRENPLFHQHKEEGLIYDYPLIQYKTIGQKAAIFCIGEGVDEMHKLFGFKRWDIDLLGEEVVLKIDRLELNPVTLNVWEKPFKYSIHNWAALNSANHEKYVRSGSMVERCQLLEKVLTANILAFAKGMEWVVEKRIEVKIGDLREKPLKYKGVGLLGFEAGFSCNVFLPNYVGLGKSASHGFGVVHSIRN